MEENTIKELTEAYNHGLMESGRSKSIPYIYTGSNKAAYRLGWNKDREGFKKLLNKHKKHRKEIQGFNRFVIKGSL